MSEPHSSSPDSWWVGLTRDQFAHEARSRHWGRFGIALPSPSFAADDAERKARWRQKQRAAFAVPVPQAPQHSRVPA